MAADAIPGFAVPSQARQEQVAACPGKTRKPCGDAQRSPRRLRSLPACCAVQEAPRQTCARYIPPAACEHRW